MKKYFGVLTALMLVMVSVSGCSPSDIDDGGNNGNNGNNLMLNDWNVVYRDDLKNMNNESNYVFSGSIFDN